MRHSEIQELPVITVFQIQICRGSASVQGSVEALQRFCGRPKRHFQATKTCDQRLKLTEGLSVGKLVVHVVLA